MSWVCHIWPLLCWGSFPLCPLSRLFLIINQWILLKAFYASIEVIIWFLFFSLLIGCMTLLLCVLKNPCIPGINPTWCMILLMCWWILFASIFMRIFASLHQWSWPEIFFVISLSGFGIRVMVASYEFESVPPSAIRWREGQVLALL